MLSWWFWPVKSAEECRQFFFCVERRKEQSVSQSKNHSTRSWSQAGEPVVTLNLPNGRCSRQNHVHNEGPGAMLRLPSRRRTTTWRINACATPAPHASSKTAVSCRALALANCDTNDLVSADQRPPTSMASTTNLARDRGPTNSGCVRSFRLLAACNTTPSASAIAPCGDPSQWRAHTSVVSTAK